MPPDLTKPGVVDPLVSTVAALTVGAVLSTVPETLNVPVPPALSVAVTGNESAPCATGDPAVVTALLNP